MVGKESGPAFPQIETSYYGPLNCKLHKAGPNRKAEEQIGMVYVEEDWVEQMVVRQQGVDE